MAVHKMAGWLNLWNDAESGSLPVSKTTGVAMRTNNETVQIIEETATVEKRDVVTGRVRVSTKTQVSEELLNSELARQDVSVSRVPINRDVEAAPAIRTEGDLTIIPVVEEVLVVEKRLVLREEIHIRQTTSTQSVEIPVTLRKQHAAIERDDVTEIPSKEESDQ